MKKAHLISLVALFAALITGGAWISLPIPPVPVVLSNLVATLSGVILGPIFGGLSVLLYLLLGAVGLPVFAGGSGGIGVFAGPTGGFLVGFFFSSIVAGLVSDRKTYHPLQNIIAILAGFVVLYAFGLPWFDARVESIEGLWAAFLFMVPYIVGDVVKAVLGGLIVTALKPYLLNLRPVKETSASTNVP